MHSMYQQLPPKQQPIFLLGVPKVPQTIEGWLEEYAGENVPAIIEDLRLPFRYIILPLSDPAADTLRPLYHIQGNYIKNAMDPHENPWSILQETLVKDAGHLYRPDHETYFRIEG